MKQPNDSKPSAGLPAKKPMGMVGAGRLTSMIWKHGDEQSGWRYRFNVFRTAGNRGRVSQAFAPADVIYLVKLAQVLAAVIADDGCLTAVERGVLKRLAENLDEFWQQTLTRAQRHSCGCEDAHKSEHMKGFGDGKQTGT